METHLEAVKIRTCDLQRSTACFATRLVWNYCPIIYRTEIIWQVSICFDGRKSHRPNCIELKDAGLEIACSQKSVDAGLALLIFRTLILMMLMTLSEQFRR